MLEGLGVPPAGLIQQFLQGAAVLERLLDLRDEFVRNVEADASSFAPAIEDVTAVLLALRTRLAVLADAGAPSQTQGSRGGWPEACGVCAEPPLDLGGGFNLG